MQDDRPKFFQCKVGVHISEGTTFSWRDFRIQYFYPAKSPALAMEWAIRDRDPFHR